MKKYKLKIELTDENDNTIDFDTIRFQSDIDEYHIWGAFNHSILETIKNKLKQVDA